MATDLSNTSAKRRSHCASKDEQPRLMSHDDNKDPMSTGNDDTSEERGVSASSAADNASDSKLRDDGKRTQPDMSATRGALASGDTPRRQSQRHAESSHRASTIYASVPVESEDHDNRHVARNERYPGGTPSVNIGVRLHNPLEAIARDPHEAPDQSGMKRSAEDPPKPAAKRHASHMRVGPLAPPPSLPSLPIPAAPTLRLPTNNTASQSTRTTAGAANPPIRSVNYHANHPLLSGKTRTKRHA
jgi:hypothetical protein